MAMKFLYVCDWCSEEDSSKTAKLFEGCEGPFLICAECDEALDEAMADCMRDRVGVAEDERTHGRTEEERGGA